MEEEWIWNTNTSKKDLPIYMMAALALNLPMFIGKPTVPCKDNYGIYFKRKNIYDIFTNELGRQSVISFLEKKGELKQIQQIDLEDVPYATFPITNKFVFPKYVWKNKIFYVPKGRLRDFHPAPFFFEVKYGYIVFSIMEKKFNDIIDHDYDYNF